VRDLWKITWRGESGVFTFRWTNSDPFVFSRRAGAWGEEISGPAKAGHSSKIPPVLTF